MNLKQAAAAVDQAAFEMAAQLSLAEAYLEARMVLGEEPNPHTMKAHLDCLRGRIDHLSKLIRGDAS